MAAARLLVALSQAVCLQVVFLLVELAEKSVELARPSLGFLAPWSVKYGYEIVEALEKRTEGVLAMGQSTLYPMLYNLEAKGFVAARWDESGPRPRKYYRLTSTGKKRLVQDSMTWSKLTNAMEALGLTQHITGVFT